MPTLALLRSNHSLAWTRNIALALTISLSILLSTPASYGEELAPEQVNAIRLFRTLTGTPLRLADPRLPAMAALVSQGDKASLLRAAEIATDDDAFYDTTLFHWASHMSTRDEFQNVSLNDFIATIVGHTARVPRADARELLYGDFRYEGNLADLPPHEENYTKNFRTFPREEAIALMFAHYKELERRRVPLRSSLTRVSPQREGVPGAGLFTTTAWAISHLANGTNRRIVEYTFREFMCQPISAVADASAPKYRIRQDVDRAPGGNVSTFSNRCSSCHSVLDGLAGAFAEYNFHERFGYRHMQFQYADTTSSRANNFVSFGSHVIAGKMLRNEDVHPWSDGSWRTTDDSFVNFATFNHNELLGWRGSMQGNGPVEYGQMIGNSFGFSRCMAKRVYSQLCLKKDFNPERLTDRDLYHLDSAREEIEDLAKDFESSGYDLRGLFERAAITPKCYNN